MSGFNEIKDGFFHSSETKGFDRFFAVKGDWKVAIWISSTIAQVESGMNYMETNDVLKPIPEIEFLKALRKANKMINEILDSE